MTPENFQSKKNKTNPQSGIKLIVGLGNPGTKYVQTRHNAGFLVLDALLTAWGGSDWQEKKAAQAHFASSASFAGAKLIKPQTFMNASGKSVVHYVQKEGLEPQQVLLVHDDLDLPFGRLRFKLGGGAGGQRGVQDTISRIGKDFYRLKIGIGRPPPRWQVSNWVLSKFAEAEDELLKAVIQQAVASITCVLRDGMTTATNHTNGLDLRLDLSLDTRLDTHPKSSNT